MTGAEDTGADGGQGIDCQLAGRGSSPAESLAGGLQSLGLDSSDLKLKNCFKFIKRIFCVLNICCHN